MPSVVPMSEQALRTPDDATVLQMPVSEQHLFDRLTNQFRRDARASEPWRRKMKEWYAMLGGTQWDAQTLNQLKTEQRPALTFNKTGAVINVVCGIQVSNRQDVHIFPRTQGDAEVSELATQSVKWFDDRCNASSEESRSFRDMLVCGIGVTETRIDHLDDPRGKGYRERRFPGDFFFDADARKANLEDARRMWLLKVMELDEVIQLFPDVPINDLDADWTGLAPSNLTETIDEEIRDYRDDNHSSQRDMTRPVRIIQAQWWEREYSYMLTTPDGQEIEIEKTERRNYVGIQGYDVRRVPKKVWKYAIIGKRILSTGDLDPQGQFHFKVMTGEYDEENNYWYGLMKSMVDPQKWQNKLVSAIIHILGSQSLGGIMFETDAFVNKQKAMREWTKPNSKIEMAAGALTGSTNAKVQAKPVGQLPTEIASVLEFARTAIYECPGVPFELLAQDVSDQLSGVQEFERTRRGINVLASYFDSNKLYRMQNAELTLDFNRAFFEGQLMRITEESQQKYVEMAFEEDTEAYDFIIDDSPTSPNMKERTWQLILPLLPIMLQAGAPPEMFAIVLEYSPLPSDIVKKLIGAGEGAEELSEEEKQERDLMLRQVVAEIIKTESEARENEAQSQKYLADTQLIVAKTGDVGFRQSLDGLSELHEMKVAAETPQDRKQVVDIQ
ncbi:hypothetical protein N9980_01310 [bacterium]|nr:hypothetical protein [bacterium]